MPRLPRFRTQAIARLREETRFAPARTQARMAADAEAFLEDVDPLRGYATADVTERVTRYRPDAPGDGAVLAGGALIADLAAFVLHATSDAPADARARGGAIGLDDVARSLGVDVRTVLRFRRDGLVMHHVRSADDAPAWIGCFADAIARFRARQGRRVDRAARTGRLDASARDALGSRACALLADADARARPWSLHALAAALAPGCGRSARTVRTALDAMPRVHAALAAAARRGAARTAPARVDPRAAQAVADAMARGEAPGEAGARLGLSASSAQRAGLRLRAAALEDALRGCPRIAFPLFAMRDADRSVLAPAAVRSGLPVGTVIVPSPAPAARIRGNGDPAFAMLVAHHFLVMRAQAALASRPRTPGLALVDAVERDLRWAHRLARAIVERALPAALVPCVQRAGRPWPDLRPGDRAAWASFALAECARALDALASHGTPPGDEVRPVRVAALGVERAIARLGPEFAPPRAVGERAPDAVVAALVPWSTLVPTGDALLPAIDALDAARAAILRARFGLGGEPPCTVADLAGRLRVSAPTAAARLHDAMRALRAVSG